MAPRYLGRMRHMTLGLCLGLLLVACGKKRETITPTLGPITESVYASGVVKAEGQYQVFPTVNGTVTALLVAEGDTVAAGQPLLRIDDRSSSATARNADAQLRLLEQNASDKGPVLAQLREAMAQARDKYVVDSTNYVRQQTLWAQQIGSRNELDQRELAFTTSKAAFVRASKAYDETKERLRTELDVARNNVVISSAGNDDRTPRSLIDGIVYDLRIEPGELATTQRAVAVIGSASELYLELEVDEYDITRIQLGQEVLVTLDSYSGQTFPASVSRIVPLMDERSRTFRVEARFTGKPPRLYPNLTAEASIVLRRVPEALTIPAAYLVADSFVLSKDGDRVAVTVGARDMEKVQILSGIEARTEIAKP